MITLAWAWMAALGVTRHTGIVRVRPMALYRLIDGGGMRAGLRRLPRCGRCYAAEYQQIDRQASTASRLRLYRSSFCDDRRMPPPDEQAAIVRFLAGRTAAGSRDPRKRKGDRAVDGTEAGHDAAPCVASAQ